MFNIDIYIAEFGRVVLKLLRFKVEKVKHRKKSKRAKYIVTVVTKGNYYHGKKWNNKESINQLALRIHEQTGSSIL